MVNENSTHIQQQTLSTRQHTYKRTRTPSQTQGRKSKRPYVCKLKMNIIYLLTLLHEKHLFTVCNIRKGSFDATIIVSTKVVQIPTTIERLPQLSPCTTILR